MDRFIKARGYQNRSEAVRDLVRAGLVATKSVANRSGECVASLAYLPAKVFLVLNDKNALAHGATFRNSARIGSSI